MTPRNSKFAVVLCLFLCAAAWWNGYLWYQERLLSQDARLFQATCQRAAGCALAIGGWHAGSGGMFYTGHYEYTATNAHFELRQHVGTDVWLVAEGGKAQSLEIHRDVQ
jgi:hypothetical protein